MITTTPMPSVTHLAALGDRLVAAVGAERIGTVFCDSLEVYEADWTPRLPDEFAVRRGYRLEPELHLLVTEGPDSARFRADYYRTLSELYEENFLGPLADWAHGHGLLLRVQSYGEPPATLSSYARVDAIEGEQWGWTTMPPTKWASSAAHHLGVPVVSSETWTWVHAPSFRATPLDLKGEAHEHFLLGINQLIGHGWPCSPRPDETQPEQGLGWFFYASGALDDRNAWWPAAAGPDALPHAAVVAAAAGRAGPRRAGLPADHGRVRPAGHRDLTGSVQDPGRPGRPGPDRVAADRRLRLRPDRRRRHLVGGTATPTWSSCCPAPSRCRLAPRTGWTGWSPRAVG